MQKLTKYLCGIVQQAAKIAEKPFNIYAKDTAGDVVTDIDKAVETFLIEKLNRKYPEFDILSEEFNPDQALSSHCFVIDPIDGTKNFAAGLPLWGTQIAAVENSEVVASVIYLPKFNELYYADSDGAFLNGMRLEIMPQNQTTNQLFAFVIDGESRDLTRMGVEINRGIRNFGSAAVSYAWVAAGRFSGYSLCVNNQWDYMPGMYLVKMAGGFNNDEPNLHIAATNPETLKLLTQISTEALQNNSVPTVTVKTTTASTKNGSVAKSTKSTTKK